MHISEGILSGPVLIAGAALAVVGAGIGLKRLNPDQVPKVSVLSAAFFVASLVHIPIGPANVHLTLNGLMGLCLGWAAFPAIMVALILQTLLFQYGGLTTLGVNSIVMASPALVCFFVFKSGVRSDRAGVSVTASFLCGFGSVLLAALLMAFSLFFTGEQFLVVAKLIVAAHLPVMIIEGLITVIAVKFIKQVKPEILEAMYAS
ncbi:cobalt transporter CbiM [Thermodesulfobacteriota bacterium]